MAHRDWMGSMIFSLELQARANLGVGHCTSTRLCTSISPYTSTRPYTSLYTSTRPSTSTSQHLVVEL